MRTFPGDEHYIKLKEDYKSAHHPPRSVPVKAIPSYKEELL